jgi:cell division septal protein FtsQ
MAKNQWKKPYRVKRKKSLLKSAYFRFSLLFVFFASGIFYLICLSPLFQLKSVEISGNQKIETQSAENFVREKMSKKIMFFKTGSIFLTSAKSIKNSLLSEYSLIDSVLIKKKISGQVFIAIEERQPVAVVYIGGSYYYLDSKGIVFEKISAQDAGKTEILAYDFPAEAVLGQKIIEPDLLSKILDITGQLNKDSGIFAASAEVVSKQRLNIKTSEGWEIYFNLSGDLDWQMTELKTVLENKISSEKRGNLEYIDLRFDMIFVSPEGITTN